MFINKQILSNQRGATILEFAISSVLIFMFLILGFDILRMAYQSSSIQYVLAKGASYGVIQACSARDASGAIESTSVRRDLIRDAVILESDRYGLGIEKSNYPSHYISVCTTLNTPCPVDDALQNPGDSKDFIRVDVRSDILFFWGAITVPIYSYVIVKNEAF